MVNNCPSKLPLPEVIINSYVHTSIRWLVEFNSFVSKDDDDKKGQLVEKLSSSTTTVRPLTENSLLNRPKWFAELTTNNQRRRMSEQPASNLARLDTDEHLSLSGENLETRWNISSDIVGSRKEHHEDSDSGSSDFDDRLRFAFAVNDFDNSRNSSSNDSKGSLLLNDSIEEDILNFGLLKSVDALRVSEMNAAEELIIPEMPAGNELVFTLMDNWGDEMYIGLNGIEILDPNGNRPNIKKISLVDANRTNLSTADTHKLFDKLNRTQDDNHIWQYCFGKSPPASLPIRIVIQFEKLTTLALLRIWNHNKSRIHSYRGVKTLQINLDGHLIFKGEIVKASGDLFASLEHFGDVSWYRQRMPRGAALWPPSIRTFI